MLHHKLIAGEIPGTYLVTELINEEDLLTIANQIARQKLAKGEAITDKHLAHQALQGLLQTRDREVFAALFLDNQHRILAYEELFLGTLSAATVYPRDVVKRALHYNAAALILVHNHPSGYPEPSRADIEITLRLQNALALVDIRILDHLVVGTEGVVSLAERGNL
ncbi:RadC family protein [Aeromonas hydrophila]|nr:MULTISPECIES: DNA repair protein RadC [Aeromonas]AHV33810.1 DNA repair protein RadC [Aeromonas hydrophila YL17]ELC7282686.1 DNA repair protein RadC [Aeromonas veronii]MBL0644773.1 DNA repair protein RadC [Aeromonas veronii]MCK0187745.1 DNA repair protein RadC [Aeromonas hydrophila]MDD1847067.1 DNA repair protein RadC [Aeromonas veronii]